MANNQKPEVLVVLGSANDGNFAESCLEELKRFEVSFSVKVASAHRSPERVVRLLQENDQAKVIIAFAGHAAHLAGVIAAHTTKPVVAVPLPTSDLDGMDSLLASVQMPAGVPVAVMAIGKAGSRNAACFAAQILAHGRPDLADHLKHYKKVLAEKVEKSAESFESQWQ